MLSYLCDDLNAPRAVATLHTYGSPRLWKAFDPVLGLDFESRALPREAPPVPAEVQALVDEREAARKARDWPRADALRKQAAAMGWEIADTPEGPVVKMRG